MRSIIKTWLILFWLTTTFLNLISGCSGPKTGEPPIQLGEVTDTFTVEIVTVKNVNIDQEEVTESFLYAKNDAFVLTKVDGVLIEVYVDLGDEVSEGDTLAKIEDKLLSLEYKLAKNYFDQVKQEFERYQSLYNKKLISESEYEQIKLKCEQADIEQQWAHERLRQTRVIAPFAGVIVSNFARIGQAVQTGDSLFHLTERFPVYTRVFLNEEQLSRLKTNGEIRIEPKYGTKQSTWAKIVKKSPTVDPATGMVELIIQIDTKYRFFKPGMTVNVFLRSDTPEKALAVHKSAFSQSHDWSSRDTTSIHIFRGGSAIRRQVQIVEDLDSLWEIKGEINAGDSVIVSGHTDLKDGQTVKISGTFPHRKK